MVLLGPTTQLERPGLREEWAVLGSRHHSCASAAALGLRSPPTITSS